MREISDFNKIIAHGTSLRCYKFIQMWLVVQYSSQDNYMSCFSLYLEGVFIQSNILLQMTF